MFIMGPMNQLRKMFDPVRLVATLVYLSALCLTIYFGFFNKKTFLALIFAVVEVLAFAWYSLSYIPFAQGMARRMVGM